MVAVAFLLSSQLAIQIYWEPLLRMHTYVNFLFYCAFCNDHQVPTVEIPILFIVCKRYEREIF